jgi:hypothetical protein
MSPHLPQLSALMDAAARAADAGDDANSESLLLQSIAHGEAQRLEEAVRCFKRALKDDRATPRATAKARGATGPTR